LLPGSTVADFFFRFQDSWSYYIPGNNWKLLSGPTFPASVLANISVTNGINFPKIGESSNSTVIPGIARYASFTWKRHLFLFGGFLKSDTVDLVMSYMLCSENQIFDGRECRTCPFGKAASNESFKTFESCEAVCALGSVWNGNECLNCTSG
jgi:hypothetical protein